jgi:hypothetical protein
VLHGYWWWFSELNPRSIVALSKLPVCKYHNYIDINIHWLMIKLYIHTYVLDMRQDIWYAGNIIYLSKSRSCSFKLLFHYSWHMNRSRWSSCGLRALCDVFCVDTILWVGIMHRLLSFYAWGKFRIIMFLMVWHW